MSLKLIVLIILVIPLFKFQKYLKTRGVRTSRGKLGGFPARAVPISPISHFTLKMNSPLESP
jgi:hypothetical protein